MASVRSKLDEIVESFSTLEDPRSHINRRHPLPSILVIAVLAVLAGAAGPTAIARWAKFKEDLLAEILDLPNGIPGKDVFRRVLMIIKPDAFEAAFTAWAGEYGLALGQQVCAEKSNEITAIPELLKKIDVRGGIVTIDAMGTQKAIAAEIIGGQADYVLALKRNHESLHAAVIEHIDARLDGDVGTAQELTTTDLGHGRQEERTSLQLPAPEDLPGKAQWKGLKSVGVVTSRRNEGEKESIEVRYYLSSLPVDVNLFARAVRGHWSVENACHWTLDVTYREDDSRIRERVLGSNITWLYRFTLSILKQHPDRRLSLIMRRRLCGWSEKFLMEVINALVC